MATGNEERFNFGLGEAVIRFSTNNAELMTEIHKDFGIYETRKDLRPDGQMRVIQTNKDFPLKVPKYAIRETVSPQMSIFNESNNKFIYKMGERIYRIDFERNIILSYIRTLYDFSYVQYLLKWLLIKSLEKRGAVFIPGSGIERNGIYLLFLASPGFDETHNLITFLLNGYKLTTDSTIFFRGEKVLPFYLRSRIHPTMFTKFPILKENVDKMCPSLPDGSVVINLREIFPFQEKEGHPSKLFYMRAWNAPETKIEVVSKKEILSRLLHIYHNELSHSMWSNYEKNNVLQSIFPGYQAFVEKADCYKVCVGSDQSAFLKTIQSVTV
ncbi:MAG: hypothetical protein ACFFBD_08400 [Candidatus Hodarchaeota archaeon]